MRILYIDVDSLRPDRLGCYGYHRATSPHIDQLAKEGARFDRYFCSDAPCLPSRTALLTGRFGIHSGVVGHGGTTADLRLAGPSRGFRDPTEAQSLPSELQRLGFYTAQVSPFAFRHGARHFYAGFNEMHNTGKGGMESAEAVTPTVREWLERRGRSDRWFLHVNYWDPHMPYRTPLDYGEPFAEEPLPDWPDDATLAGHQAAVGPHTALDIGGFDDRVRPEFPRAVGKLQDRADLRRMVDGYDTAVRYVDDQVGEIVRWLKAEGLYDDTAIIVSADHGENFGELAIYGEHATADVATCRIPMIVKWPKMPGGIVVGNLHYALDLAPTLAELLQGRRQPLWDGISFARSLHGERTAGRDYLVLSQCAHVCQRGVRFEHWLYLRTYHDGLYLFPREMLFDLDQDPHEQRNLAGERRATCDQALRYLAEWHDEMMLTMPYDTDPLWTTMREGGPFQPKGRLEAYCQRLEHTGRGWAVAELRARQTRVDACCNPAGI